MTEFDPMGVATGMEAEAPAVAPVAMPDETRRNLYADLTSDGPSAAPFDGNVGLLERGKETVSRFNGGADAIFDYIVATGTNQAKIANRREQRLAEKNVYAAMPAAQGFAENAIAVAGGAFGAITDPLNILPVPGIGAAAKLGSGVARVGAMAGIGAGMGAAMEGSQQAADMALGIQPEFHPEKMGMAALVGAGLLGGLAGGVEGVRAVRAWNDAGLARDASRVAAEAKAAEARTVTAVDAPPMASSTADVPVTVMGEPQAATKLSEIVPESPLTPLASYDGGGKAAGDVFLFDPKKLEVDPQRFQFKSDGDAEGVNATLKAVTKWRPESAGAIIVWEDKSGKLFVADGHQRTGLARRLGGDIQIPGYIFREADGVTSREAMTIAALKNIREGSGSVVDAAKVLRTDPKLLEDVGQVSKDGIRQATALARLDGEAWRMVVNETVPANYAAEVGRLIKDDPARQLAAINALAKADPSNVLEAQILVRRVSESELAKAEAGRQGALFDMDAPESTVIEEMKILARAVAELKRDKVAFARVVRDADRLETAGSSIARAESSAVADEAGRAALLIQKLADKQGDIRDSLLALAKEVKSGQRNVSEAARELAGAVRDRRVDPGVFRADQGIERASDVGRSLGRDARQDSTVAGSPGQEPVDQQGLFSLTRVDDTGAVELAPNISAPKGIANLEVSPRPQGVAPSKASTKAEGLTISQVPDRGRTDVYRRELAGELRADVEGKGLITTTLAEAMDDVSTTLGSALRKGGVGKALGTANMDQSVIRLRSKADFQTFMHEAGHIADRTLFDGSEAFQAMRARHASELAAMDANTDKGKTAIEGFAEFMRVYGTNRAYAEQKAPRFFAEFDPWFRAEAPDIASAFDRAHDAYHQFLRSAPAEAAKTQVTSNADLVGLRGIWAETDGLPVSERLWHGLRYYANNAYGKLVDEWRGIGVVQDRLTALAAANERAIPKLAVSDDAKKLAQMLNGSDVAGVADMTYGVRQVHTTIAEGPTLSDALLTAFSGKLPHRTAPEYLDFSAYLVAKRSEHLYSLFDQGRIPSPPVGDSWDRVSAAVRAFEERYPAFKDGAGKIYEINNLLLKKEFDAGLLSEADFAKIAETSQFYVPFYRAEEKVQALGLGQAASQLEKLTRRYGGDPTAKIIDPIEATIQRANIVNKAVRENQVFNALADLADAAGPGSGKYFENLPKGTKESDVLGQPYVTRFVGGEKLFSRFGDDAEGRWVYNSLREMEPGKFDIAARFLALFASTLSRSVTMLDPSFFIANLIRDQMTVFTTQRGAGNVGYIPALDWLKGVSHIKRGPNADVDVARLYAQFGGHRGGQIEETARHVRDSRSAEPFLAMAPPTNPVEFTKNMVERGFKFYTGAIEISETGTRYGIFNKVYRQARKEGLDEFEAAMRASYEARDIMDFSRVGSALAGWKAFAPFINPNIQGWDRSLRGLLNDDKVEVSRALARYAILAAGHVQYWAAMKDDRRYEQASDKIKERYWILPSSATVFGDRAEVIGHSVPKPFDLAGLMINLQEEGLNWWATNDPQGAKKFAKALIAPITDLPIQNPLIAASYGLMANHDFFFGKPIVPAAMTKLPAEMQKFSTTDPTYVWLGKQLNVSPLKLQFAARSLMGQTPEKMTDAAADVLGFEATPGHHVIDNSFLRLIGGRFTRDFSKFSQNQIDMLELMSRDVGKATLASAQFKEFKRQKIDSGADAVWQKATDTEKTIIAIQNSPNVVGLQRLIHPLERANEVEKILSGMTREMADKAFEEEKPRARKKGEVIEKTPIPFEQAEPIINLIRDIRNRETYNALAIIGRAGYDPAKITPQATLDEMYARVERHNPAVHTELMRRIERAAIPNSDYVREVWPDLKLRSMEARDSLDVSDLIAKRRRR